MKRCEKFYYFDYIIFYFGRIITLFDQYRKQYNQNNNSIHGIVGRPFTVSLFPMVPKQDVLQQKNIWAHLTLSGWKGGLNKKRNYDVLRDKLGMAVALY